MSIFGCACADPRCDAAATFEDEGPGLQQTAGTCPCGGTIKVVGELNTLVEVTEFLECQDCRRRSERTRAVLS